MIKVLHTEWSDGWGGQEIRIINEMLAARKKGIESLLACKKNSKIYSQAIKNSFTVFPLPFKGNTDIFTVFRLVKIIKQYGVHIVNTHSGKDTWVGGMAAKFSNVKFIRTRHLSNPINPSRLNFINQLADFVFTTGNSVKNEMIKNNRIDPNKITSIPTGPSEYFFNPSRLNIQKCREKFYLNDDEVVIGMLAVLRKFKRHDRFINMAENIIKSYPEKKFRFLIAGDGPQKLNILAMIKAKGLGSKISLIGHIENQPEFLKALDIFVICSDSGEGVPQALIQALMMETVCVSSNVGSVADLFFNQNFKMFDKDSQISFDHAVKESIANLDSLKNQAKGSRDFIVNNFSSEEMIRKIISIYKKILS